MCSIPDPFRWLDQSESAHACIRQTAGQSMFQPVIEQYMSENEHAVKYHFAESGVPMTLPNCLDAEVDTQSPCADELPEGIAQSLREDCQSVRRSHCRQWLVTIGAMKPLRWWRYCCSQATLMVGSTDLRAAEQQCWITDSKCDRRHDESEAGAGYRFFTTKDGQTYPRIHVVVQQSDRRILTDTDRRASFLLPA